MPALHPILAKPDEAFPAESPDALILQVFRHIGAAYETGDADCWEAAHARAEHSLGSEAGSLLVARAATMLRLVRVDRPDFIVLPMPCHALSRDEAALLHLLRAARRGTALFDAAARILDDDGAVRLLAAAASTLVGHAMPNLAPSSVYAATARRIPARSGNSLN